MYLGAWGLRYHSLTHITTTPIHRYMHTVQTGDELSNRYDRRWLSRYGSLHSYFEATLDSVERNVACLTPEALARRPTAGRNNVDAQNIYGPMEAGFTDSNFACLGSDQEISGGPRYETCRTNGIGNFFLPR